MYWKKHWIGLLAMLCSMASARDIHVSVKGNDANPGSEKQPYQTIGKAAEEARPGDIITVHEGIYREQVRPKHSGTKERPIVYQAAKGEKVVITGSERAQGWTN